MSQIPGPVNYDITQNIIAQTFGASGMLPYQSELAQVADNILLNTTTTRIQSQARAELAKILPRKNIPTQYCYTTNINSLKDFMVIRLYSPSKNRVDVDSPLVQAVANVISGGIETFNKVDPTKGSVFDGPVPLLLGGFVINPLYNVVKDKGQDAVVDYTKNNFPNAYKLGTVLYDTTLGNMKLAVESNAITQPNRIEGTALYDYLEGKTQGYSRGAFYNRTETSGNDQFSYRELVFPMPIQQLIDTHTHEVKSTPLNPIFETLAILGDVYAKWVGSKQYGENQDSRTFQGSSNPINYLINAASATSKKTFNPNVEVLYQAPTPREFVFTINYVPTNRQDADTFILMCEMLKEHSYPAIDGASLFYNFPGTCDFEFYVNNRIAGQLPYNKKPCFLTSVQISYINGTETYTHYYDGNPTSIVVTLQFLETQLLSRYDFIPTQDREKIIKSGEEKIARDRANIKYKTPGEDGVVDTGEPLGIPTPTGIDYNPKDAYYGG